MKTEPPIMLIEYEKTLKMKRRSWIHNYKNKSGVTLLPTKDLEWLIKKADMENEVH